MAIQFVLKVSYEEDDGQTCGELCKLDHGFIDILGDYLVDQIQSDPVKSGIIVCFTNICAEKNENLKEAVIGRGQILSFLQKNDTLTE